MTPTAANRRQRKEEGGRRGERERGERKRERERERERERVELGCSAKWLALRAWTPAGVAICRDRLANLICRPGPESNFRIEQCLSLFWQTGRPGFDMVTCLSCWLHLRHAIAGRPLCLLLQFKFRSARRLCLRQLGSSSLPPGLRLKVDRMSGWLPIWEGGRTLGRDN